MARGDDLVRSGRTDGAPQSSTLRSDSWSDRHETPGTVTNLCPPYSGVCAGHHLRDVPVMTESNSQAAPLLLLGPLLRYVDQRNATVWVETDRACTVTVAGHSTTTWAVHGHHFALVVVEGLQPGSVTEYTVRLDDRQVWPEPDSPFPPSVIRTHSEEDSFRLAFGSCRRSAGDDEDAVRLFGADALVGLANKMLDNPDRLDVWPDALFMAGDQIYADELTHEERRRLLDSRGITDPAQLPPGHPYREVAEEIQTFEEYSWLYHGSWSRPHVRWLLSTVPTMMILDDHDLRDDWNTSQPWRDRVTAQPWWRERVIGAFGSYWVYQHLGNLPPAELAAHETYQRIRSAGEAEASQILDELAERADTVSDSGQWSFSRDLGTDGCRIRFVAIDSRGSRQLTPGRRRMVDEQEWAWIRDAINPPGTRIDHLLIGTSLPVFMLPAFHHLEGWNEAVAEGAWGPVAARLAEWLRQVVDLEHWSAFRASYDDLVALLGDTARTGQPETILLLSGDVHASYIAAGWLPGVDRGRTALHQLTMSPFRNPLHTSIRIANRLASRPAVTRLMRRLARTAKVPRGAATWHLSHGVWFDNGVMTVVIRGRRAMVEVDHAVVVKGRQVLERRCNAPLSKPAHPRAACGPAGPEPGR